MYVPLRKGISMKMTNGRRRAVDNSYNVDGGFDWRREISQGFPAARSVKLVFTALGLAISTLIGRVWCMPVQLCDSQATAGQHYVEMALGVYLLSMRMCHFLAGMIMFFAQLGSKNIYKISISVLNLRESVFSLMIKKAAYALSKE
jgi:hypothetical protein